MKKKKKSPINLAVSEGTRLRLSRLVTVSEAASMSEVVRNALRLYEHVITNQQQGGTTVLVSKEGVKRELVLGL